MDPIISPGSGVGGTIRSIITAIKARPIIPIDTTITTIRATAGTIPMPITPIGTHTIALTGGTDRDTVMGRSDLIGIASIFLQMRASSS